MDLSGLRAGIGGAPGDAPVAGGGVPDGDVLGAFALAVVDADGPDDADLVVARTRLRERLGPAALADAAGVVANFELVTRVADATGCELDDLQASVADDLLTDYDHRSLQDR